MGEEIQRISEPAQVNTLLEKLFLKVPVQVQDRDGLFPAKIRKTDSGIVIVHNRPDNPVRLLSINHGQNQLFLECRVKMRRADGIEFVEPTRIHIRKQIRRQERVQLSGAGSKVPWVSDAITMKSIPEALSGFNQRRDALFKGYENALKQQYPYVEVVFRKTFRMDVRMRTISNVNRSIFVPVKSAPNSIDAAHFVPFEEVKKIYQFEKIPEEMNSEISIPLWFRKQYLLGYIKILSPETLHREDYEKVEKIVKSLEAEFEAGSYVHQNRERAPVVDLNYSGVGFMHPHNASAIRGFLPGEHILFDIHFPAGKTAAFIGVIRNIKSLEKAHRMGVEFDSVSDEQRELIQEYIDSLSKTDSEGSE